MSGDVYFKEPCTQAPTKSEIVSDSAGVSSRQPGRHRAQGETVNAPLESVKAAARPKSAGAGPQPGRPRSADQ